MAQLQVTGGRFSLTMLLALSQFTYLLLGATVFQLLEKEAESNNRNYFQMEKLSFLANYSCLDGPALEKFVKVILDAWESGVNPSGNSTNPSNWDFGSSFFFAGTVVTTIGYGNLSPTTFSGQVFCVFYALCGIPLNLAFLNQLSKCLTLHLGRLEHSMVSVVPYKHSSVWRCWPWSCSCSWAVCCSSCSPRSSSVMWRAGHMERASTMPSSRSAPLDLGTMWLVIARTSTTSLSTAVWQQCGSSWPWLGLLFFSTWVQG
ncbi:potassium channel subfamily K member 16-like isoform X2 [Electrophorus electricus]|uniref:potassium channel subfamily K member 16-like isoform X2 n=1 Tax=Electrophorus electricus TaxID=8005 RepID=UPI000F09B9E7|nr:potassium channel subfamily K member 16-like isoform X2 [Electrophorus electricus]